MWELAGFALFGLLCFKIGYELVTLKQELDNIKERHESAKAKAVPKSLVIDPSDPIQMAKLEQERLMKQLNPDIYDDL